MKVDFEQLHELIRILESSTLSEIEIKTKDGKIRLRRGGPSVLEQQPVVTAPATVTDDDGDDGDDALYVTSPFVGTFYTGAAPGADPFVHVGDTISPGTVLCIVEAMKLMNEIEAEVNGTIAEVLVDNGKPVEYGDRLFKLQAV